MRKALLIPLCWAALAACGDSAATPDTADATSADGATDATAASDATDVADEVDADPYVIAPAGRITVTDLEGGAKRARIDATADDMWVQFALSGGGSQVTAATGWDLAFRRIEILSARPVAALDVAFDQVSQAPAEGYVEDNAEESAFTQLGEWWEYNPSNHTVAAKVKTFFVKVDDATYFKLAVRDYYDDAGSTGLVTLDWASVAAP
ncbi:MAG: HmuY family protein [Myxococcota bacterium]